MGNLASSGRLSSRSGHPISHRSALIYETAINVASDYRVIFFSGSPPTQSLGPGAQSASNRGFSGRS